MTRLRVFAASLWLTLATALFCAVVPVGLPHTATHGSAFNPGNSVVALHASGSTNRALLKRIAVGDPAAMEAAGSDIAAPSATFEIAAPAPASISLQAASLAGPPAQQARIAAYPRGPPTI